MFSSLAAEVGLRARTSSVSACVAPCAIPGALLVGMRLTRLGIRVIFSYEGIHVNTK